MTIRQVPNTLKFFVNALSPDPIGCYAVLITAVNSRTSEEALIDALIEQDNYQTWLDVVKQVLGKSWTVFEAIPINQ